MEWALATEKRSDPDITAYATTISIEIWLSINLILQGENEGIITVSSQRRHERLHPILMQLKELQQVSDASYIAALCGIVIITL